MEIYKRIKKIAQKQAQIGILVRQLIDFDNLDVEGIEWNTATFVTLSKADIKIFQNTGGETEDYYVYQSTGYCGDDFYGYLYFKTDVPNQYVRVYFSM